MSDITDFALPKYRCLQTAEIDDVKPCNAVYHINTPFSRLLYVFLLRCPFQRFKTNYDSNRYRRRHFRCSAKKVRAPLGRVCLLRRALILKITGGSQDSVYSM